MSNTLKQILKKFIPLAQKEIYRLSIRNFESPTKEEFNKNMDDILYYEHLNAKALNLLRKIEGNNGQRNKD